MSLNEFRSKIKTWKPENFPCKLCKIYHQRIGYLQVILISICSQILLYMFLYLFVCLFCKGFFLFVLVFVLAFAFFPPFFFNLQFKVHLNQPHIPDKGSICSLIYFLFICIFYWSTINIQIIIINQSKHGHCHEYFVMGLSKCFQTIFIRFQRGMDN